MGHRDWDQTAISRREIAKSILDCYRTLVIKANRLAAKACR
jgi:hypothetical protein